MELDEHLKKLMQDLGVAINDALSDSTRITAAIDAVRESGYDVFLVLEATIGLNHRHDPESTVHAEDSDRKLSGEEVQLKINAQDMKFLKSLKIRVDDLDP